MWILEENNRNVKWNNPLSLIFPLWPWKVIADHSIRWPVAWNLSILHLYIKTYILRAPPAVSSKQLQMCHQPPGARNHVKLDHQNKAALIWEQNPSKISKINLCHLALSLCSLVHHTRVATWMVFLDHLKKTHKTYIFLLKFILLCVQADKMIPGYTLESFLFPHGSTMFDQNRFGQIWDSDIQALSDLCSCTPLCVHNQFVYLQVCAT